MNCNETQDLFSAHFDGELSGAVLQEFEAHGAACEDCRRSYEEFERATRALKSLEVRDVDRAYVDELVAGALPAGSERVAAAVVVARGQSRWRPVLSHAAAVLLGAALVLLFLRPSPVKLPTREIEAVAVPELRPLEHVEPIVHIIEHIRERVHSVEVPVFVSLPPTVREVDTGAGLALFAEALHAFGGALWQSTERLAELRESSEPEVVVEGPVPAPETPMNVASAPETSSELEPVRQDPRGRWVPPVASRLPQSSAAVVVERNGSALSLQTSGTLDEIVPALISRLDDADPIVAEVARGQLREIRERRREDAGEQASPEDSDLDPALRRFGWRRWTPSETDAPTATEKWSEWWTQERLALASAPN